MPVPGIPKVEYFLPVADRPVRNPRPPTLQPTPDFEKFNRNGPNPALRRKKNPMMLAVPFQCFFSRSVSE